MYKILNRFESYIARLQGKGYGTNSISKEVGAVHKLYGAPIKLAIDIGGNVGNYTAKLAESKNHQMEIHVFEPASKNIEILQERFKTDQRITVVPKAISSKSGMAMLHANVSGSGLGSLTRRRLDHFGIPFEFSESVETLVFEDYWTEILKKRAIDLVKLDVEGHELDALQGFGAAMANISVIQFEFGGCNIDTRTYFQDFWYLFKDHGFELYRITPFGINKLERYQETDEYFSTTNYLAHNASDKKKEIC